MEIPNDRVRTSAVRYGLDGHSEGVIVSDKSPRKTTAKKPGRTLKEKRTAKRLKKTDKVKPFLNPQG